MYSIIESRNELFVCYSITLLEVNMNKEILSDAQLEHLGTYIRGQLPGWLKEDSILPPADQSGPLLERMVKMEEALKHQTELLEKMLNDMNRRFVDVNKHFEEIIQHTDKRFEDMNKRFEDMNKRFEENRQYSDKRFTAIRGGAQTIQ